MSVLCVLLDIYFHSSVTLFQLLNLQIYFDSFSNTKILHDAATSFHRMNDKHN